MEPAEANTTVPVPAPERGPISIGEGMVLLVGLSPGSS